MHGRVYQERTQVSKTFEDFFLTSSFPSDRSYR